MKIILSGNPLSTQSIYRYTCVGKFARLYMTRKGKQMKELYRSEAKNQYKGEIISGDCDVEITLFFKDKRRRDVDNFSKILLDSLEGVIFEDDTQIQKMTITKKIDRDNPRVEVSIESI